MAGRRPTTLFLHGSLPHSTTLRPSQGFDLDIVSESDLDVAALRALVKQALIRGHSPSRVVFRNYDQVLERALRSATARFKRAKPKTGGRPRAALRSIVSHVRRTLARILAPRTAPRIQHDWVYAPLLWVRLVRSLETEAIGRLALCQRCPIRT